MTACRNTAAYCIFFLTFWNFWLRQQISKIPSLYKVSLSFRWNDEGKQAVKTKAECFKAWRLFLFSSLFLSNMHYWLSVKSVWLDIWPNSFFGILLDFLKVLYFSWLVMPRDFFARSLRDLMHWCSLRSLLRTYQRSTCSKSSVVFTETKLRPMKKERRKYPAILTEEAWSIKDFLWPNYSGFDSQRFFLLLFSVLRVSRLPRHWFMPFSRLPFPASFAWTLNVPTVHCAILSLVVAFSVFQTHLRWDVYERGSLSNYIEYWHLED